MWHIELREKTKNVFRLPGGTQIGFEPEENIT